MSIPTTNLASKANNIDKALADIADKATANTEPAKVDIKSASSEVESPDDGTDRFADDLLAILKNAKYDDSGFSKVRTFASFNKAALSRNLAGVFSFVKTANLEDTTVEYDDGTSFVLDPIGTKLDLLVKPESGVDDLFLGVAGRADIATNLAFHKGVKGWPAHPDGDDFGDWDSADWSDICAKVGIEYLKGGNFTQHQKYLDMNIFESCPVPPLIKFDFTPSDLDVILTSMKQKIADKGAATIDMNAFLDLLDETIKDKNPGVLTIAEMKIMQSHLKNVDILNHALTGFFNSASGFMVGLRDYLMKIRNTVKSNEGGMELSFQSDETAWIDRLWDQEKDNYKPGVIDSKAFILKDAFVIGVYLTIYKNAIDREIAVRGNFLANFFDDIKTNAVLAKSHADLLNMYNDWRDDVKDMQAQFKTALDEIQTANNALIEEIRTEYGKVIKDLKGLVKEYAASLKKSNALLVDYGARLGNFSDAEIQRQVQEGIRLASQSTAANAKSDALAERTFQVDPSLYNRTLRSSIKQDIDAQKDHLTSKWKLQNAEGSLKGWVIGATVTGIAAVSGLGIWYSKRKKQNNRNSGGYDGSRF